MLTVLVVLTLVPTWTDGLLLKKCELKSQLEVAFSEQQSGTDEDIIAKLACTVEHISGFNSSLEAITDQFNPRTLIITPFLHGHDKEYPSGMGEMPLISTVANSVSEDYIFPENVVATEEPLSISHEDKFIPGQDEVQPEKIVVQDDGMDGSWMLGDGSGGGTEETQENKGLDETALRDILQATVKPHRLPDPTDIHYDTYEMLFGPTNSPPESTTESTDIHYDTYEMLFGPTGQPMGNPMDRPQDTTGPTETKTRSKRSSAEDQTIRYGIFQLSDIACNSGSSQSLNLCGLDCSALIDDDITDDIACLMTLNKKVTAMTFIQECLSVEPSHYFAECS